MEQNLELKNITAENFALYGVVLEHINKKGPYEAIIKVESRKWIWALLTFDFKEIKSIQQHPTSKESFEPVYGTSVIVVAP